MIENIVDIPQELGLGADAKEDFPIFAEREVHFLDTAASAQKVRFALDAERSLYTKHYANVHRGVYALSQEASQLLEESREFVRNFIGASSSEEIVFTRGTTESINIVCSSYGRHLLPDSAEIIVTVLEHHANFVPWQQLAKERGLTIHFLGLTPEGTIDLAAYRELLNEKTGLVALTYVANGYGIALPVREMIEEAHAVGAKVMLDAAQAVSHLALDVNELGADFLAFSGHKAYGPTGIGILYGRRELLEQMPPWMFGGDMIKSVSFKETIFNDPPFKFEAGTPNFAAAVGMATGLRYLQRLGFERIHAHERALTEKIEQTLLEVGGVRILGPVGKHSGLVCFTLDGLHALDVAQFLDHKSVAVRAGHHCAQPLLEYLGVDASIRASVGVYTTEEDIEALGSALSKAREFLS